MKAAVVGAAGFLGRALCRRLLDCAWDVTGYDLAPPENLPAGLSFQRLDVLADAPTFAPGTDAVFYLAQSPFYRDFPESADHLFGVNTYGAIKAARAACGANARLFCYTSTGNAYAPSLEALAETHPVRRDDPYALSKVAAEEAVRLFASRMPVSVLRLFGLFGPGQTRMLPATLLARLRAGQEISLEPAEGEGDSTEGLTISFTFVDDAARVMEELAQRALRAGRLPAVLNVAPPEPVSLRRFAEEMGGVIGIEPRFVRARRTRTQNLIADVRLLDSVLRPVWTPFKRAMARSFAQEPFGVEAPV